MLEDRLLGEFNDFLLVDQQYVDNFVLEYAFRHNYTMNREAIAEAIIDRYKYWPDPSDEDAIRAKFIEVWLLLDRCSFDCSLGLSVLHSRSRYPRTHKWRAEQMM